MSKLKQSGRLKSSLTSSVSSVSSLAQSNYMFDDYSSPEKSVSVNHPKRLNYLSDEDKDKEI